MDLFDLQHAGSVFATIFVLATCTMRTMIPLRVFGVMSNVLLILLSIPTLN